MAQTPFTTKTRALSLSLVLKLSLSWQQDKKAPERHLNIAAVMEGCDASLASTPAALWIYVILAEDTHTHAQEDFLKSVSASFRQNAKLKHH